jgi:hypothetical protein
VQQRKAYCIDYDNLNRDNIIFKVLPFGRFWISNFPMYFNLNNALSQAVFHLQEVVRSEDPHMAALIDVSRV